MKTTLAIAFAVLTATTGAASAAGKKGGAAAPPKVVPACGLKSIPLVTGYVWTYKAGQSVVLIRVVEVGPGKNAAGDPVTVIKMEEKYGDRVAQATWTCTDKDGLTMGPDSFFFVGEPGGAPGTTLNITTHEGVSYPIDKNFIEGQAWVEKVAGDVNRTDVAGQGAVHKPAKFELERHVTIQGTEQVDLVMGSASAQKVGFELRGRGVVETEKYEIPIKRPGMIWVMKGLGIVKIDDAFDRTWELVSTTVPFGKR